MKFLQRANKEVCQKNSVPEDDCGGSILQNRHENFVKPTDCWIRVLACGHLRHHKSCLQTFSLGWKKTETKRIQKGDGRDNGFFLAKDCRGLVVVPRGTQDTIWKLLWRFTPRYAGSIQEDNNMSNRQESATRRVPWSRIRQIELSMFSWTSSCPRTE
jgi:hypothetical protein